MKGNDEVLQTLNELLSAELTAMNQYLVHGEMCANWRYGRLAEHARQEFAGELKHAQELVERILYLDGVPDVQTYGKVNIGRTIPEQHDFDLAMEKDAVGRFNAAVELVRGKGDNGTRALLERLLKDEEAHVEWLEAQLQQISDVGLQNYLAQQTRR